MLNRAFFIGAVLVVVTMWTASCGDDESVGQGTESVLATAASQATVSAASLQLHAYAVRIALDDSASHALADELETAASRLTATSSDMAALLFAIGLHFGGVDSGTAIMLDGAEGDLVALRSCERRLNEAASRMAQFADRFSVLAVPGHDHVAHFREQASRLSDAGATVGTLASKLERALQGQLTVLGR